ncbi:hypothetical protein Srot_2515 [Segniliparus rotundus DSM 44985]|uniref:Uncharacterized protein n=1 Tax=Segniliparus rotundus (strain ATCC BAA-972 / CDC 1076 / CIP 108378 / DSM 44985 / JCM 13578) TaxID=640132 RepID=D6ZBK0_SEGRD|nr:hypothetical protein [Segniliparus rotundus]ADG98952.1 hypothetical protein Srot_2515 [Segniliparus rotundus DSM 44985]
MNTSKTSLLASLFSLGLIVSPAASAVAEPEAAYCPTLAAALPDIDRTYADLKKAADAEAAAEAAQAEDDQDSGDEDEDGGDKKEGSATAAKPNTDVDAAALLQKEVELADRLNSQLNDLAHQTQEDGLKRIAREATDTAASFATALHEKQNGDAPDTTPSGKAGGSIPEAAPAVDPGMLAGLAHPNQEGDAGEDWAANFNFSSNKLRNEMNALNHLCQAGDSPQPPGAANTGERRGGR